VYIFKYFISCQHDYNPNEILTFVLLYRQNSPLALAITRFLINALWRNRNGQNGEIGAWKRSALIVCDQMRQERHIINGAIFSRIFSRCKKKEKKQRNVHGSLTRLEINKRGHGWGVRVPCDTSAKVHYHIVSRWVNESPQHVEDLSLSLSLSHKEKRRESSVASAVLHRLL
jgi:hypothetical protein